jgi:hypothetical protein
MDIDKTFEGNWVVDSETGKRHLLDKKGQLLFTWTKSTCECSCYFAGMEKGREDIKHKIKEALR